MKELSEIERAIKDLVSEIKEALNIQNKVDGDFCPGNFIKSEALMTVTGRLSELGIPIPLSCYPFVDKNYKQLSIKEAAKKIFSLQANGK